MKRDCQCPRVRHQHGTRQAYLRDKCRCFDCRMTYHRAGVIYANGGTWQETADQYAPKVATVRRLEALMWLGYSSREIADRTGLSMWHVQNIRNDKRGRCTRVTARIAEAVERFYDECWDKPATGPHANALRTKARKLGYLPPLAWDDDEIDDPDAEPHTPPAGGPRDLAPCGTTAAHRRHLRNGEPIDQACRNANSRASAERQGAA